MSAPVVAPQKVTLGMHRSDETGWWMIDGHDCDPSGAIVGYFLIGKNGVESWLSAERIGSGWELP